MKTNSKIPFRIRLIQLVLLVALVFTVIAWWQFLSLRKSNSGLVELLITQEEPHRLRLLTNKQIRIAGRGVLPAGQAPTTDCRADGFQSWLSRHRHYSWASSRPLETPVTIDGRKYREETSLGILGNDHGQRHCLQIENLWGDRQTAISDPISAPIWPIGSRLTNTNLIVDLMQSPDTQATGQEELGYLDEYRYRYDSPHDWAGDCLALVDLDELGEVDIPLDQISRSFDHRPEGVRVELSIPLELIKSQPCYYLYIEVAGVTTYIIHDDRLAEGEATEATDEAEPGETITVEPADG